MNKEPLRVVRVVEGTSVDGPGLRTSIYFAGCAHRCTGCHNEQTWDFQCGSDMCVDELMEIIRFNDFDVTFSGGDPIYQAKRLIPLAKAIHDCGHKVWCYTGFTFEELLGEPVEGCRELLENVDVIVDGPFVMALRDEDLLFRGSSNQRIIDVAASLASGKTITLTQYNRKINY